MELVWGVVQADRASAGLVSALSQILVPDIIFETN